MKRREFALSVVDSTAMDGLVITDANAFVTNSSLVAALVDKCRVPSIAAPLSLPAAAPWQATGWTSPQCFVAPVFSSTEY